MLIESPPMTVDLTVRPRPAARVLMVVTATILPAGLLWLAYQAARFDPRIALVSLYSVMAVWASFRSRIVVADGLVWRRVFKRYRVVSLQDLGFVSVVRTRWLRPALFPGTRLIVADRSGRTLNISPKWWTGGARSLAEVVAMCARAQGLTLDAKTEEWMARIPPGSGSAAPAWAMRVPAAAAPPPFPSFSPFPAPSNSRWSAFWTRRYPDGRPRRLQLQRLAVLVVGLAISLPAAYGVSRAGTSVVRSMRCGSEQHLWISAPDFPSGDVSPALIGSRMATTTDAGLPGTLYRLGAEDIANQYNSAAVQRDAAALIAGADVQWISGGTAVAEVQLEQFPSHQAALAFQRDYAFDHCGGGDFAFSTPAVPGGVGFRCNCRGSVVDDRVSFVRGTLRIQAIVWDVPSGAGHSGATRLATLADQIDASAGQDAASSA